MQDSRRTNLGDEFSKRAISPGGGGIGRAGSRGGGSRAGSPSGRLTHIMDPRKSAGGRISRGQSRGGPSRGTLVSRAGTVGG